ncbi:hypothetical protein [Streptomyces sp. NPDC059063]|uniref:hypothetical protein n=1 Tax=unclassified Streptomyces TaxID=2593676 RepID=UPI00368BB0F3
MPRLRTAVTATAVATVTAALAALTSCATEASQPAAGTGPTGPARELTRTEQNRVDRAEQRLIQRCMKDKGFRYWVAPTLSPDTARAFTHRFVQDDVAWARAHGYGERLQRAFLAAKKRDPNLAYRKALTPAARERYVTALGGGPDTPVYSVRLPTGASVRSMDGGCERSARQELYGDAKAFFRADKVATNLTPVYTPKLIRDPLFTTALKAWSTCMRTATGHGYADPEAVRADLRRRSEHLGPAQAHALEVKLAVAEATCARRTSLRATLRRLDRRYGDPVRDRYAEEIATSNRMKRAALRRADQIDHRT